MSRIQSVRRPLITMALLAGVLIGLIYALSGPAVQPTDRSAPTLEPDRSRPCTPAAPCLGLLIDDVGRWPKRLRELLALPLDLTYSVLPHAEHSGLALLALRAAQREYWLHLPLEPENPQMITDEPLVLSVGGPIEAAFDTCMAAVPGASGANGHMGSAFTVDRGAVKRLLMQMQRRRLPVLDSKTTANSEVCAVASDIGLPCLQRDVFLDDQSDPAKVGRRLDAAIVLARRRGWAIAVGHPEWETIEALRKLVGSPEATWVVRLSGLYAARESPLTRQNPGT